MQADRADSLTSNDESEKVEIFFSARKLADLDVVSVTDSFLKVYLQQGSKPRKEILKTQIYWNDLNPDYAETLTCDFVFEIRQIIEVEVYHEDKPPKLIGVAKASIGEIFGSRTNGLVKQILDRKGKSRGDFLFKCEKQEKGSYMNIEFNTNVRGLPVGSMFLCFFKNEGMFRIFKQKKGNQYLLHQSQFVSGDQITFKKVKINSRKLCNSDPDQPIIFKFYKQSQIEAPIELGVARTTLRQLQKGELTYDIQGKKKPKMHLSNFRVYEKYEFIDYLVAGMQMALVICIDYTASNGIPTSSSSLHHSSHGRPSKYEKALNQVSKIVMDYDTDKLVPTYGFGAKVHMPNFETGTKVHHCFPLNGSSEDPNLYQVEGILEGYKTCMKSLQFGGPTIFSPLLREAMQQCKEMKQETKQYMILLILTDGEIYDTEEVMDLLVKCGRLPLSIIIVGIGDNGNWDLMHKLDDDDCEMVDFNGNKTERDLLQFVEFAEHGNDSRKLAEEVLYELPRQVVQYHDLVGLTPRDYQKSVSKIRASNNNYTDAKKYKGNPYH